MFAGIFLSQNSFSLSKLDAKRGSLIFDAAETKYFELICNFLWIFDTIIVNFQ